MWGATHHSDSRTIGRCFNPRTRVGCDDSLANSYNDLSETGKAEFDGMMKGNSIASIQAIPANWYKWAFGAVTSIKNKELGNANT